MVTPLASVNSLMKGGTERPSTKERNQSKPELGTTIGWPLPSRRLARPSTRRATAPPTVSRAGVQSKGISRLPLPSSVARALVVSPLKSVGLGSTVKCPKTVSGSCPPASQALVGR